MSTELVLVTGGSGYLGSHCVATLLDHGYRVRTTVRSAAKEHEVRELVTAAGHDPEQVEVVTADLTSDDGGRRPSRMFDTSCTSLRRSPGTCRRTRRN